MKKSLTKNEFYVLNNLYNESQGRTPVFSDLTLNHALSKSFVLKSLEEKGFVDSVYERITIKGIEALEPYKVKGAVIMAAGPSTRCIPLSLELPKALFEVKGQKLIERKILQLKEAGIDDITVVLGYKKEMLTYLADQFNVRIIENDEYLTKNNIYSLYAAKDYLEDAYICACDDYFVENPYNKYEFDSFYSGYHVDSNCREMFAYVDEIFRIIKMSPYLDRGYVLLGNSFWTKNYADKFISLVENEQIIMNYQEEFWEWLAKDYIDEFPTMYFKEYANHEIVEFDYFSDLRRFDSAYVKHANSQIIDRIVSVFHCTEADVTDFRNVSEGMTNTSFIFKINGIDYIYRHPGDGTEKIVNRRNEKTSLELAKKWDIDPTYYYMDVEEGWKISVFIHEFREPNYSDPEDSKKVISVLRKLHSLPIKTDYGLKPWEDALGIEKILEAGDPECFSLHLDLKKRIGKLMEMTEGDGVEKCFCHGDTYKPNWMIRPDGSVILIDWEYSGYSDPGIDVGYYIVDAMYDVETGEKFIEEYLGDKKTEKTMFHFMAYTAIIAYYWFVWALYRESCGANMGDALENWRQMADRYSEVLLQNDK